MKTWKLTFFDLFSLDMVIKGQLLGRYDAKLKSAVWSGREKPMELVELDRKGHSVTEDIYTLTPKFNTTRFKAGRSRALEAYRIKLDINNQLKFKAWNRAAQWFSEKWSIPNEMYLENQQK